MENKNTMIYAVAGLFAVAIIAVALVYAFKKTDTESDNSLLGLLSSKTYDLNAISNHDLTGLADTYYNYLTVTDRDEPIGDDD